MHAGAAYSSLGRNKRIFTVKPAKREFCTIEWNGAFTQRSQSVKQRILFGKFLRFEFKASSADHSIVYCRITTFNVYRELQTIFFSFSVFLIRCNRYCQTCNRPDIVWKHGIWQFDTLEPKHQIFPFSERWTRRSPVYAIHESILQIHTRIYRVWKCPETTTVKN